MPFYVPQPHVDPLDLDNDEEIMRETEAVCRRDPGFMPLAQWEASMLRRLAEKPDVDGALSPAPMDFASGQDPECRQGCGGRSCVDNNRSLTCR
jgi:hypothetical protein